MKKHIIYTITVICIILTATTLVTGKNTTGKTNAAYVTRMKQTESQYVLSAKSTKGSYRAYVRKDESKVLYIQDQKTDKMEKILVEPHLASGIMSMEWFDDQTIIVYSHISPHIGCASVYDVSTKKLIMEKYCSKYSFGNTLKSFVYVESAPRNLGRDKIVNYKDKMVYQTKKNQCIRDIVLNHKSNDIALVVGKYADDSETQHLQVEILEKRGNKYIKVKSQKLKSGTIDSIRWKNNKKVVVVQNGQREIVAKKQKGQIKQRKTQRN